MPDTASHETVRDRLRLEPVKVERRECWKEKVESRKGSVVEKVLTGAKEWEKDLR